MKGKFKLFKNASIYLLTMSLILTNLALPVGAEVAQITTQPADVSTNMIGEATFGVETSTTGCEFEWFVGQEKTTTLSGAMDFTLNGATKNSDGSYTLSGDSAIMDSTIFTVPANAILTIKYVNDHKPAANSSKVAGQVTLSKDDGSGNFSTFGATKPFDTTSTPKVIETVLEAGNYTLKIEYENTDTTNNANSVLKIESITIKESSTATAEDVATAFIPLQNAVSVGKEKTVTLDKSDDVFGSFPGNKNEQLVICKITNGKDVVYSKTAKLTVAKEGTEVVGIKATYADALVEVGKALDTNKITVTKEVFDYASNSGSDVPLADTEYTLPSSLTVTKVGDNEFDVSYGGVWDTKLVVKGASVPTAPQNVTYANIKEDSATISWEAPANANGSEVTKYILYNGDKKVGESTTTSYNLTGLTSNTNYTIKVVAVNAIGESTPATVDFATSKAGVRLDVVYPYENVLVGEKINKDNLTVKVVYENGSTETLSSDAFTVSPDTIKKGNNDILVSYKNLNYTLKINGYELEKIEATYTGGVIQVGKEFKQEDVSVKATYSALKDGSIKVEAVNSFTLSGKTVEKSGDNKFTVTALGKTCEIIVPGATIPGSISKLEVTQIGDTRATVSWAAPEENGSKIISYKIYLDDTLVYDSEKSTTPTATSYTLSNLKANTEYSISVIAVNALGNSNKTTTKFTTQKSIKNVAVAYSNESALVGKDFDTSKVAVTVTYSDDSKLTLGYADLTSVPKSIKVEKNGWNEYKVEYNGNKLTLRVHGYSIDKISATYADANAVAGSSLDKAKVKVTATYTADLNNAVKTATLGVDDFTLDKTKVETIGKNTFEVKAGDKKCELVVMGIEDTSKTMTSLTASYANECVTLGSNFDTSKVKVIVTYSDGSTSTLSYDSLSTKPSSTQVTKTGWNEFGIGYKNLTTTLKVWGYQLEKLDVTYKGKEVEVNKEVNKADFYVVATYSKDMNGATPAYVVTDFTLSKTKITNVGDNVITVSYGDKKVDVKVTGKAASTSTSKPSSGTTNNNSNSNDNVQTGDETGIMYYLLVFGVSVVGLTLSLKKKRR